MKHFARISPLCAAGEMAKPSGFQVAAEFRERAEAERGHADGARARDILLAVIDQSRAASNKRIR